MRWHEILRLRVRSLFRRTAVERDLDQELRFHLEQQVEENRRAGMGQDEARFAALRTIGGLAQIKEECRDTWSVGLAHDAVADLRYALRILGKDARFTLVAILTLTLGIGATTAIFSVVNGVLLAPLPFRDADRIVAINTRFTDEGRQINRVTGGDLVDLLNEHQVFEAVGYYYGGGEVGVQVDGAGSFAGAFWTNPAFLRVFGVSAESGRLFGPGDADGGAVVTRSFAERSFGSAAGVLGRTIAVDNRLYTIVGVVPATFHFPAKADVWLASPREIENTSRTAYNYRAVAKLRAGMTRRAAEARLATIGARLARAFPGSNRDKTFVPLPLGEQVAGQARPTLLVLLGAVALLLVVACVNVANLLLARAASRTREMAIRAALGASRARILRQLLIESFVLSAAGGAIGLLAAWAGTRALVALAPADLPRIADVRVDLTVLAFAAAISVACSLAFGLAPAVAVLRTKADGALGRTATRGLVGARSHRLARALVVAEIALSFALAIGGGLLFRTFIAIMSVDLGYRPDRVLVMYAHAPAKGLGEYLQAARLFDTLSPALRSIPGVKSVAAAMGVPMGAYGSNGAYLIEGTHADFEVRNLPQANFTLASAGYFRTLGIPLSNGRDFDARDTYEAPFVAVVSDALARITFRGENPIGRRIRCGLDAPDTWMTIVGVVGDVRQESPTSAPAPTLYMPLQQHPYHANEVQVVIRADVDAASLTRPVGDRTHALNPAMATRFTTLDAMVAESIATPRFRTFLVAAFAILALLLAMTGIYGVVAYVSAQRTAEFGVRLALGANGAQVFRMVVGGALRLAAIAALVGLMLSLAAGRLLEGLLFGLEPVDPITYAVGFAILFTVAAIAAALPAWRAARVDPALALREG